ncbi:MAG TPA: PQQ-binding-like beta-propeller repeat protein [Planctomycetota bacterium]|nr:PQQ-binding-like beta-propeller repeat protein [Planctomycetota bacterium]
MLTCNRLCSAGKDPAIRYLSKRFFLRHLSFPLSGMLLLHVLISAKILAGEADPNEAKAKGPEHNVTLSEEPGVLDLLTKAQKARARAEKDPEVWPECVKYYAEILKKYPNTVYLDRWEGPDKTEMAYKNGLYKSTRERVAKDIASLPPGGLNVYRVINDPIARALFNEAQAQFDERQMEQVAQEYFPTSFGDDALLWLAEVSSSRGAHRQTLLRLNQALKHPNPSISKTALLVRMLQAQAGLGDRAGAEKTLQELDEALKDEKSGPLRVGHDEGPAALARLKERVLKISEQKAGTPAETAANTRHWETYFGNASHNKVQPSRQNIGLRKWSVPIRHLFEGPGADATNPSKVVHADGTPIADPTMNYHLTAKDSYFYIADSNMLAAYPTGNPQPGLFSAGGNVKFLYPNEAQPAPKQPKENQRVVRRVFRGGMQNSGVRHHPHFATIAGERVYVALGAEAVTQDQDMWRGQEVKQPSNYLVCLGYQSGKLIWSLQPDLRSPSFEAHSKADQDWLKSIFFVSAPTYDSGVLYCMGVQVHGLHDAWVAAFDAENGRLIWRTQVCSANPYSVGGPVQPDLGLPVAVANGSVFVCTNLGGVAALDAMSGTIKWLRVYDRQQSVDRMNNMGRRIATDFWAPNPPVLTDNLVIVTPQDSEFLYAYDIESGRRVWEVSRTERDPGLKHILGIASGNLVVTGGNIHFYELKGGRETGPANDPIVFESPIKGRGTVTENVILVPTEKALVSIDVTVESGKFRPKVRSSFKWIQPEIEAGNIVVAGDVLYTVSRTHVNAYFVWEEMEGKLRARIKQNASDLAAYGELADVYHKVDKFAEAIKELDTGIDLAAKAQNDPKVAAMLQEFRRKKFDALMEMGRRASAAAPQPNLAAAYESFKKALEVAQLPQQPEVLPVTALRGMAETAAQRKELALAVEHYQQIITQYGDTVYSYVPESSAKARLFAQARIEEIRKENPAAYEKLEALAKAAFEKAGSDSKQLNAMLTSYPNSAASGLAMLKLAQLALAGNPDQARQHALNFLSRHSDLPEAGNATALLAIAYERGKLLGPAKDVLRRLASRKELMDKPVTIDPAKPDASLAAPVKAAEWAAKRLTEPQFQNAVTSATLSHGDGKLKLAWTRPAPDHSVPLQPSGIAPLELRRTLFYIENQSELIVQSGSERGEEIWQPRPKLPQDAVPKPNPQDQVRFQGFFQPPRAVWAEHLLLALGSREVVAYDSREKGKVVWRKELKNPVPQQRCSLQVSFGRVVIGYPSGGLSILDALSGEQLWSTQVEGNQFFTTPAIGDGFVAIGAQNPARVTIFDLETGNRRGVVDAVAGNLSVPPEAQGDRIFVADRGNLKAIDGTSGKLIWNHDFGGNITRLQAGRELVVAVIDGRRVAAMSTTETVPGKIWSPVLDKDATVKDVYIDGDDLYVVVSSVDRKGSVSAHSIRLQGKKQWEVDISSAQSDLAPVSATSVSQGHLMLTQSNWDPNGDKPASVVLIDRKTGRINWAESLGAEHRTMDNDGLTHPAFTAQMIDGGIVITESKKRTAYLLPDAGNLEEGIKKLQQDVAAKPADMDLKFKLALRLFEKGEAEAAANTLAAALGSKDLSEEKFAAYFAEFARLRQEQAKKQKRTFMFNKVADGTKLDLNPQSWSAVSETVLANWNDVYFVSDDETSGAIKKNHWKGAEDLKVSFRGAYDDKNLYMLFVVTDDKHKNEHADGTYCDVGDSVKVVFDNDRGDPLLTGGMGYRGEDFALGACVNDKGAVLGWRWVEHGQYLSGNTPLNPAPEVARNEAQKQTIYKLTLPLEYLTLKAEPNRKFGFSFIVNDQDDGAAVTKSIGGSPGVLGPPYPALFSEGVLVAPK